MRPSLLLAASLAGLATISFLIPAVALWPDTAAGRAGVGVVVSVGLLAVALLTGLIWWLLNGRMVRPAVHLARQAEQHARVPQTEAIKPLASHALDRLPKSLTLLSQRLIDVRGETDVAIAAATHRAEEQKRRLEAILIDLDEGVIVCNATHRILLYNQSAARILSGRDGLGLGRPLFDLLTSEPVRYALEQLTRPGAEGTTRRIVCATADLATLLDARLSLVRDSGEEAAGYVLSFADVGHQVADLALRDEILREVMVDWRRPLANLSAAAEMLSVDPDLARDERQAFEDIVFKEVAALNERFGAASRRYERIAAGPFPMSDVHSPDLFGAIKHRVEADQIVVTPVGLPVWLYADSHSLMLAIEHLIRAASKVTGATAFDLKAEPGPAYIYVEISWDGVSIPGATTNEWLGVRLEGAVAARTLGQIIEQHGSELWSQQLDNGRASLRLPIKSSQRGVPAAAAQRSTPRPEYYDFGLFKAPDRAIADAPLSKLSYVVFDTETTGLRPSDGDKMISIGAIRVVNGRILTGETFERLINPGRPIPELSRQFHGISDDMVRDKPPSRIVLPQFKTFAGDAVLIAYNAAFDMKFLELAQDEAGVEFENPVLDALLLAIYAHDDAPDHSLSAMAARYGLLTNGRHTALADALMTAGVWVHTVELLAQKGVTTFAQAAQISTRMMTERQLKSKF